jgi:hypothetical protein
MWAVATTETFDEWFAELAEDAQAEIIAKADKLYDAHLSALRKKEM